MSTSSTLATLGLIIDTTAALAELGVSMQDLVNRQKQAEIEGREFGAEDLDAMRSEVDANLDGLEKELSE